MKKKEYFYINKWYCGSSGIPLILQIDIKYFFFNSMAMYCICLQHDKVRMFITFSVPFSAKEYFFFYKCMFWMLVLIFIKNKIYAGYTKENFV
jgi:hypothetical protein